MESAISLIDVTCDYFSRLRSLAHIARELEREALEVWQRLHADLAGAELVELPPRRGAAAGVPHRAHARRCDRHHRRPRLGVRDRVFAGTTAFSVSLHETMLRDGRPGICFQTPTRCILTLI